MTGKIVYIAAPYTLGDTGRNIWNVIDCANNLCDLGFVPYIPHLTHFWHIVSPKPAQFWYEYDLVFLSFCDCLLRLPGESIGADNEVKVAKELCIPVYYSVEELTNEKDRT